MAEYNVSFMATWSTVVEADSFKEAAELASFKAPACIELDGFPAVVNIETEEYRDEVEF